MDPALAVDEAWAGHSQLKHILAIGNWSESLALEKLIQFFSCNKLCLLCSKHQETLPAAVCIAF